MKIKNYIEFLEYKHSITESHKENMLSRSNRQEILDHIEYNMEHTKGYPALIIQQHDIFQGNKITLFDIVKLAVKYKREDFLNYLINNWEGYKYSFDTNKNAEIKADTCWEIFENKELLNKYLHVLGWFDVVMASSSDSKKWELVEYCLKQIDMKEQSTLRICFDSALGIIYKNKYSISNAINLLKYGLILNYWDIRTFVHNIEINNLDKKTIFKRLSDALIKITGDNSENLTNYINKDALKWFNENLNDFPQKFVDKFGWLLEFQHYTKSFEK